MENRLSVVKTPAQIEFSKQRHSYAPKKSPIVQQIERQWKEEVSCAENYPSKLKINPRYVSRTFFFTTIIL